MSIAWGMVFFGAILAVAGIKNVSVFDAARGDFTVAKPASVAGVGAA